MTAKAKAYRIVPATSIVGTCAPLRIGDPAAFVSDFVPLSEQQSADEHAIDRIAAIHPLNIRHSA
jgi:hypothetical protein